MAVKLMKPIKCLVVEDDEDCRWVVMRSLMKLGFGCEAARDGEHALELLSQDSYQVVVTDLRMPKKHGFNLAAEIIKTFGPKAPAVIIYTGIEEPKLVAQLLSMGVEDVCIKPMNPDILAAKVMSVYQRRSQSGTLPATKGQSLELQGKNAPKKSAPDRKVVKLAAS